MKIFLILSITYMVISKSRSRYRYKYRNQCANKSLNWKAETKKTYDYYLLSLQYKPAYCNYYTSMSVSQVQACNSNKDIYWTIHGLWPNSNDGEHPNNCQGENFNYSSLPDGLQQSLETYWPSLVKSNKLTKFLNHEWTKHGSCMDYSKYGIEKDFQIFYFNTTIGLRESLSLDNVDLPQGGLSVDETVEKFQQRLGCLGCSIMLVCKYQPQANKNFLREVRILLDFDFKPFNREGKIQHVNCKLLAPVYLNEGDL